MNIRHILVEHIYEAEDILRHLKNGENFVTLAKKYSKCSSASEGGDLSMIPIHKFDAVFQEEVRLLKPGAISKPFKTRFGVHIVLREPSNSASQES